MLPHSRKWIGGEQMKQAWPGMDNCSNWMISIILNISSVQMTPETPTKTSQAINTVRCRTSHLVTGPSPKPPLRGLFFTSEPRMVSSSDSSTIPISWDWNLTVMSPLSSTESVSSVTTSCSYCHKLIIVLPPTQLTWPLLLSYYYWRSYLTVSSASIC